MGCGGPWEPQTGLCSALLLRCACLVLKPLKGKCTTGVPPGIVASIVAVAVFLLPHLLLPRPLSPPVVHMHK